tara:strand:- start:1276 stop:1656 length:381 start_codon:yes stop_codon:yes gene_type:complete
MNFVNLEFTPVYHMIDASDSDLGDEQYRSDLLRFFKCSEYNDTVISIRTDKLFHQLKEIPDFMQIFTLCLNNPIVSTVGNGKVESVCLTLLFSFDFLHLFISALKEYKNDKNISSETYEKLRQLLQ